MDELTLLIYAYDGMVAKGGEILNRIVELQRARNAVQARAKDIRTKAARRKPRASRDHYVDVTDHSAVYVDLKKGAAGAPKDSAQ